MNQIDHLLGPHDDSSPLGNGLSDASGIGTPAHPDSSKSDERATASGTLTISQAAALLGVGSVETVAVQDSGWSTSTSCSHGRTSLSIWTCQVDPNRGSGIQRVWPAMQ